MRIITAVAAAFLFGAGFDASAQQMQHGADASAKLPLAHDVSAQRSMRRARTAIRIYPRPLYRECRVRYVREFRLSGPVIVPAMRCWWVY